jgi:hypothetical protein
MGLANQTMHSLIGNMYQGVPLTVEGILHPINIIRARGRAYFCMDTIKLRQMLGQSSENIIVQQHFPHIPSERDITFEDSSPAFESIIGIPEINKKLGTLSLTRSFLKFITSHARMPNYLVNYQQIHRSPRGEILV